MSGQPPDDAALLGRTAEGDQTAFAVLVDRHAPMILAVCRRYLDADAEDAAQEALVKAWRAAGSFSGRSSVRTWLYRIAVNAARDRLRYHQRRPASADADVGDVAERLADPVGLDEQLTARGLDPALRQALARLPRTQREAVVLADVVGVSHAELAQRQGVAAGTVKSRLHRAHARLAELLTADAGAGPTAEPDPASDTSKRWP